MAMRPAHMMALPAEAGIAAAAAPAAGAAAPASRAHCAACLRAQTACICHWVRPVVPATEVVILQSPLETHHVKGSARLLHLSLTGSVLLSGERFDEAQLAALLFAPLAPAAPGTQSPPQAQGPLCPVLLYPDDAHDGGLGVAPAPPLPAGFPASAAQLRLIVLDATWRKSRKMLYQNPLLQRLPRLALHAVPPSRYRMRKAQRSGQLSTLEAVCLALMQLEGAPARYEALLAGFDGFVGQQLARMAG